MNVSLKQGERQVIVNLCRAEARRRERQRAKPKEQEKTAAALARGGRDANEFRIQRLHDIAAKMQEGIPDEPDRVCPQCGGPDPEGYPPDVLSR